MKRKTTPSPLADTPQYGPKEIGIAELTAHHGDLIRSMFADGVRSLRALFGARRTGLNRDGDFVDLGPDYLKRITGLQLLLDVCTRGRKPAVPLDPGRGLQWEEWQALMEVEAEKEYLAANPQEKVGPKPAPKPSVPKTEIPTKLKGQPVRICDLTEQHGQEIEELFQIGLESIRDVFAARRTKLNREGDVVDLGPDHQSGLAAFQLLMTLSIRGRQPLPPPRYVPKPKTWEQVQQEMKEYDEREQEQNRLNEERKLRVERGMAIRRDREILQPRDSAPEQVRSVLQRPTRASKQISCKTKPI